MIFMDILQKQVKINFCKKKYCKIISLMFLIA